MFNVGSGCKEGVVGAHQPGAEGDIWRGGQPSRRRMEVAGAEPTCEAGHAMTWCSEGAAGQGVLHRLYSV